MGRTDHEFIVETLARAVEAGASRSARLQYGLDTRERMQAAWQAGESFEHYRVDWLRDASTEVIDLLQQVAQKFDATHPNDLCSVQDFIDILNVVKNRLVSAAQKKG